MFTGKLNVEDLIPDQEFMVYKSLGVAMKSIQPVLVRVYKKQYCLLSNKL